MYVLLIVCNITDLWSMAFACIVQVRSPEFAKVGHDGLLTNATGYRRWDWNMENDSPCHLLPNPSFDEQVVGRSDNNLDDYFSSRRVLHRCKIRKLWHLPRTGEFRFDRARIVWHQNNPELPSPASRSMQPNFELILHLSMYNCDNPLLCKSP